MSDLGTRAAEELPDDSAERTTEVGLDLPAEVERLEARCLELTEAHARAIADYRNLERRTAQGRVELRQQTTAAVVTDLLPVYDDLTRALEAVGDDLRGHDWLDGITLIREKFQRAVARTGAEEFEVLGTSFDPRVHQAVGFAAGRESEVVAVVQSGWTIGDQLIRPAMVMVGNGDASSETQTPTGQQSPAS